MIQNISVRIHPEWSGKISELSKTSEEMKSNPGVTENSAILSHESVQLKIEHPYAHIYEQTGNPKYKYWKDLLPTDFYIAPYMLCAKPYAWLMFEKCNKVKAKKNLVKYGININGDNLKSEARWVTNNRFEENYVEKNFKSTEKISGKFFQLGKDQDNVIKGFFKNVQANKSLCFIYAKSVDFSEKPQRILVGIGRVNEITYPPQYAGENPIECELWETRIKHSISPDSEDCVLLPYDELQEYAKDKRDFKIDDYIVFASDDFRSEFSYGAEWVSYDGAIDTILKTKDALQRISDLLDYSVEKQLEWLQQCLDDIYKDRWIYPGLGEMLYALGLNKSWLQATENAINAMKSKNISFIDAVDKAIYSVDDEHNVRKNWTSWSDDKKHLFEILSRMSLSEEQASKFFDSKNFGQWDAWVDCPQLLENPYLIYEHFSNYRDEDSLPFIVVDNAMFPQYQLEESELKYSLQSPSKMNDSEDIRRVHALIVMELKKQVEKGNSLYPAELLIQDIRKEILAVQCSASATILNNIEDLIKISMQFITVNINLDGKSTIGFQLKQNADITNIIAETINKRSATQIVQSETNWEEIFDNILSKTETESPSIHDVAKEEKCAILPYMENSKIFVLTGGAGTGKTTLLSCLASFLKKSGEKILAIAPTGKAMVRLRETLQKNLRFCDDFITYKTIAQLLLPFNRYNPTSGQYNALGQPKPTAKLPKIPSTIFVDECSMLTEEMLAALFKTVETADRIILSGDANQLPPIGCGRPFLDILTHFKETEFSPDHPHYGVHFGELQVSMRQQGENRSDLAFAKCFKRECTREDLKFFRKDSPNDQYLNIKKLNSLEDIETSVIDILNKDILYKPNEYLIDSISYIDDWEILSPTRRDKFGTIRLNDIIRKAIPNNNETETISQEDNPEIRIGEKIICTQNGYSSKAINSQDDLELEANAAEHYVANGDIGYITNIEGDPKVPAGCTYSITYKGQDSCYHKYSGKKFLQSNSSEDDTMLQFAYALTVHKCQGSQFKKTLVVLNKYSPMLSRELLYTAFSRQEDKLVVLFNDDFSALQKYCDYTYSEMAKRITDLFTTPILKVEAETCYDTRYMKQDDIVKQLCEEQKQKEAQEVPSDNKPSEVLTPQAIKTEEIQKKPSIFTRILKKFKSLFSR